MDTKKHKSHARTNKTIRGGESLILSESDKKLNALLKVIPSGIIIIEPPDSRITYVNDRAVELFGFNPLGLTLSDLPAKATKPLSIDGDESPQATLPLSRALFRGETVYDEEIGIEQPGGQRFIVAASAAPIISNTNEITAAIGIFHDITPNKQTELKLQKQSKQLETLVRQQTDDLTQANQDLEQEIVEHQQTEKQVQSLSLRLVNTQEKERRRVGHELHDQIGGTLSLLIMAVNRAKNSPNNKIIEALDEIEKIADEIYEKVRSLSHSLKPDLLDELGLIEALTAHFEEYISHCGIKVSFQHTGLEKRLTSDIEIALFRITQEALVNVARHAEAKNITVVLSSDGEKIRLRIQDDGHGFNPAEIGSLSSGISGMQDRAILVGGQLTVNSSPGNGTCIICEVPVENQSDHN